MSRVYDYLIVGAGCSGLFAAKLLEERGATYLIIEKSNNIGGKISSRRFKGHEFNMGAEHFTFCDYKTKEKFKHYGLGSGLIRANENNYTVSKKGLPLNAWTKNLIDLKQIIRKEKVIRFHTQKKSLIRVYTDKSFYHAKNILITAPAEQALDLLRKSSLNFPVLEDVKYSSEIFAFFRTRKALKSSLSLGKYSLSKQSEFLGDNQQYYSKYIFSDWFEESKEEIKDSLSSALDPNEIHVHKWKFSRLKRPINHRYQRSFQDMNIYLCGDYFTQGGVEGALLSVLNLPFVSKV